MDSELELPGDWGRRVRAARGYMESNPSAESFGDLLNRSGMRGGTVRKWEAGHFPPSMSREAIVRRLSEVSGLPPAFFTADLAQLFEEIPASVQAQLDKIQSKIDAQSEAIDELLGRHGQIRDAIADMGPEETFSYLQEVLRAAQRVLVRSGEGLSRRDLERLAALQRGDPDPPAESSPAAA